MLGERRARVLGLVEHALGAGALLAVDQRREVPLGREQLGIGEWIGCLGHRWRGYPLGYAALHLMRAARSGVVLSVLPALVAILAGCGAGGGGSPDLSQLPLVDGASIVTQERQCDRGANAFCALELVVVDRRYRCSDALRASEHHQLHSRGWRSVGGDTGEQLAANSPGHKLRLTYSTAAGDLEDIDLGWIQRPRAITLALSRAMFDRTPAMSMMLEVGAS